MSEKEVESLRTSNYDMQTELNTIKQKSEEGFSKIQTNEVEMKKMKQELEEKCN